HAPSTDGRAAQGADDVLGRLVRHLDDGESLRTLERANGAGVEARLVGDRSDKVGGPHAGAPAKCDVKPRDIGVGASLRARPASGGSLATLAFSPTAVASRPSAALLSLALPGDNSVGNLFFVGRAGVRCLVRELHSRRRHIHDVELFAERSDDDTEAIQVSPDERLA